MNNRKKDPDYCTKILSTDVCKSEETGRSTLCWEAASLSKQNFLRLSSDNFRTALNCTVKTFTTQIYNSTSDLKWSVRNDEMLDEDEKPYWVTSDTKITADAAATGAKQVVAINDCVTDILLAHADGTWGGLYYAQHVGFKNGWNGTEEQVSLNGKTRITDVFTGGGTDSAMLFLTDASNGDALFVDDIYSSFGDAVRLTNLTDVFAGAGKDILDFTSQRYEYAPSESEISLHGGDGDDVIWGPNTASKLFGDNGNDRIVGGSGDDLIVGGEGNNDLHGGGGNDTFCFYNNPDDIEKNTVTQLDGGSVILWFDKDVVGEWDEETLTFTYSYEDEGNKSTVIVKGVEDDDISIRIGDHDYDDTEVLYADKYAELVKENAFAENSSNRIYVTA